MDDILKEILIIAVTTFLFMWGCHSCQSALDDMYPPVHTDWKAIERENAARRNYTPPPLSDEEQLEKDKKDSVWREEGKRRKTLFFNMIRAAGKAEEKWRQEHKGVGEADVMSTYDEGYENGFIDRQEGRPPDDSEFGISYDEGYLDGYGK